MEAAQSVMCASIGHSVQGGQSVCFTALRQPQWHSMASHIFDPDGRRASAKRPRTVEVRLLHGSAVGPVFGRSSATLGALSLSQTAPARPCTTVHVLIAACVSRSCSPLSRPLVRQPPTTEPPPTTARRRASAALSLPLPSASRGSWLVAAAVSLPLPSGRTVRCDGRRRTVATAAADASAADAAADAAATATATAIRAVACCLLPWPSAPSLYAALAAATLHGAAAAAAIAAVMAPATIAAVGRLTLGPGPMFWPPPVVSVPSQKSGRRRQFQRSVRVPGGQACAHVFSPSLQYILVCVLCVCGSVFSSPLHPLPGPLHEC
jgi:hypothetical protein